MKNNQEYKNAALEALKGRWPNAVVCTILFMLIALGTGLVLEFIDVESLPVGAMLLLLAGIFVLSVFVLYPLEVGYYNTFRKLYEEGNAEMTHNMFNGGFSNVVHNAGGMLLMDLFIALWSLLLFVPGLVKAFSYAMTPYILQDFPELSANQAIDRSRAMMKGHKFDLFYLYLSFIGWGLLCILTLGIGFFWLMPYMYTASAAFYQDLKAEYESKTINNKIIQ